MPESVNIAPSLQEEKSSASIDDDISELFEHYSSLIQQQARSLERKVKMVSAPVFDKSDPKSDQVYPYHLPQTSEWAEYKDPYGQTAMTAAGAGMFVKQPIIVWGAFILAVISLVNQQPLRQGKDTTSPLLVLGMAAAGIAANLVPKLMLVAEAQTAVPVA